MLMSTYGCIRVYNADMAKIGRLYQQLEKEGKKIYCYVEDCKDDIDEVYELYDMDGDKKDVRRTVKSKKQ